MTVMSEGKEERKRRDSRRAMTPRGLFTFLSLPYKQAWRVRILVGIWRQGRDFWGSFVNRPIAHQRKGKQSSFYTDLGERFGKCIE